LADDGRPTPTAELPSLDPLDKDLLDDLVGAGLRFITSGGAGFDGVDIDYLSSRGVRPT
jgi:lactate dehydrogenase-like 2-hydroxyacid dehydrogenase